MAKFSLPIAKGDATPASAATSTAKTRAEGGTVMTEIQHEIDTHEIVLYMKGTPNAPQCGFSARAAAILQSFGKPVHGIDILADGELRQAIKDFSEWPTIPQIYIKGEFLGGSDILMEMYQNGELKKLIEQL